MCAGIEWRVDEPNSDFSRRRVLKTFGLFTSLRKLVSTIGINARAVPESIPGMVR